MPDIDLVSRLAGGMLGLLVGDAVGVPASGRLPRGDRQGRKPSTIGAVSRGATRTCDTHSRR